jgi:hypothetical protein
VINIPIQRNLQGHPEAPRLWHKHINTILVNDLGLDHMIHEPCLYFKHHPKHGLIVLFCEVDNFLISAKTQEIAKEVQARIQSKMTNKLNNLGIINASMAWMYYRPAILSKSAVKPTLTK